MPFQIRKRAIHIRPTPSRVFSTMGFDDQQSLAAGSATTYHELVQRVLPQSQGNHAHGRVRGSDAQAGAMVNPRPSHPVCNPFPPRVNPHILVPGTVHLEIRESHNAGGTVAAVTGVTMMPMCLCSILEGILAVWPP